MVSLTGIRRPNSKGRKETKIPHPEKKTKSPGETSRFLFSENSFQMAKPSPAANAAREAMFSKEKYAFKNTYANE